MHGVRDIPVASLPGYLGAQASLDSGCLKTVLQGMLPNSGQHDSDLENSKLGNTLPYTS
jgi:hypothetical protein